jgi:hypothetical protein
MSISNSTFVLIIWAVAIGLALIAIPYAVFRGWRDGPDKAVAWRKVRFAGAFLGLVGLVAGMLALEKTIREFNQDSERYLMDRFLELKLNTTLAAAIACSGDQVQQESKNECFDFKNIDNQVSFALLRSGHHFVAPSNWQGNKHLDKIIADTTRTFAEMNRAIDSAYERPIVSQHGRLALGFVALLVIIVALACSIGEATFQWRQEIRRQLVQVST